MSKRSSDGTERPPLTVQIPSRTIVIAVLVVTAAWLIVRLTDVLMILVFAILLALIDGVEVLGMAGALLAVPVTVIICVITEELRPSRKRDPDRFRPMCIGGIAGAESN
jgi:predicted PurR-regulated permease PerM